MIPFPFLYNFLLLSLFKMLFQFLGIYHFCVPKVCRKCNSPDMCTPVNFLLALCFQNPRSLESGLVDFPQLSWWDLPPFWGFPSATSYTDLPFSWILCLPLSGFASLIWWSTSTGGFLQTGFWARGDLWPGPKWSSPDRSSPDLGTQEAVELVAVFTKLHPRYNKWPVCQTTWCAQKWSHLP